VLRPAARFNARASRTSGSATARRCRLALAASLVVLGAPVVVEAAGPATESTPGDSAAAIDVELNRVATRGDGCRLSFVIRNGSGSALSSLQLDLVLFDRDGLIVGRTAAEAGPLPAGKTSVKDYDLPDVGCDALGRILINDVVRCETAPGEVAGIDCLDRTRPASRVRVELFK
jgi:hypothetical protein